jgi:hypothetical protein
VAIGGNDLPAHHVFAVGQWSCKWYDEGCLVAWVQGRRAGLDRLPVGAGHLHLGKVELDGFRKFELQLGRRRRRCFAFSRLRRNELRMSERLASGSEAQENTENSDRQSSG